MKKTDYCLVYADYPVTVFGEHDIAYVSPNVTVLASNCARSLAMTVVYHF